MRANASFHAVLRVAFISCVPLAFVLVIFSCSEKLPLLPFSGATLSKVSQLIKADVAGDELLTWFQDSFVACIDLQGSHKVLLTKTMSQQQAFVLLSWQSTLQQPDFRLPSYALTHMGLWWKFLDERRNIFKISTFHIYVIQCVFNAALLQISAHI